jgi:uncharacterized membrane protein
MLAIQQTNTNRLNLNRRSKLQTQTAKSQTRSQLKSQLKLNKTLKVSSGSRDPEEFIFTEFYMENLNLSDIYEHICFDIFKNELNDSEKYNNFLNIMEKLSFINIKSSNIVSEVCDVLNTKNIKAFDNFVSNIKTEFTRKMSIFRFDPRTVLHVYLQHKNIDNARDFLRYIIYSLYLPLDMKAFLERYASTPEDARDVMIPKVIYSWQDPDERT